MRNYSAAAVATALLLLFTGCAKGPETVTVFLPRLEESGGPDAELRRTQLCAPDKVSLAILGENRKFLHSQEFRTFFDCLNYDRKFQSLEPLIHSPGTPRFLEALVESFNAISSHPRTGNIRDQLQPWFQEHRNTGVAKIDHVLPVVADVIRNPIFREGLPLLATLASEGKNVWQTSLQGLSRLVYDPAAPDLWAEFRKLFNVRRTGTEVNHLAITTREFFAFLRKDNPGPDGKARTNALALLDLADDLNRFQEPPEGLIALIEYANNRDIFGTLYQEAGGAMRGEQVLRGLNGDSNMSDAEIRQIQREKYDQLLSGGKEAPIMQLAAVFTEFNQPRPEFLSAIAAWLSQDANKQRIHRWVVEFMAQRLVAEVARSIPVSRYLQSYFQEVLGSSWTQGVGPNFQPRVCTRLTCAVSPQEFAQFVSDAFAHENFTTMLATYLSEQNRRQFSAHNADLLDRHGGLLRDITALYRAPAVQEFAAALMTASIQSGVAVGNLRQAINVFARGHMEEIVDTTPGAMPSLSLEYEKTNALLFEQLIRAWHKNSREAWGESIVLQEIFRLIDIFVSDIVEERAKDTENTTLAQWTASATYSNPAFVEKMIYEGRRSGLLTNLDEKLHWLKEVLAPEIFASNPSDLNAAQRLIEQIPNFFLYIESGMARGGNNVSRALSERDKGYLIRTYVNLIAEAYKMGWVEKLVPVWKDFSTFMEAREERVNASIAELDAKRSPEERARERWLEARQQSDGVDALKKIIRQLTRPPRGGDWSQSLLGQILVPLRNLAIPEKREETNRFLTLLADRTIGGTDAEIDAVWDFFSSESVATDPRLSEAEVQYDRTYRRELAELLRQPSFPTVLVELDGLFQDRSVAPALDFFAEKIERGELGRVLELMRRVLGIERMAR